MKIPVAIVILVLIMSGNSMTQVTHASISQQEITIGERVTLSYSLPVKFTEPVLFDPAERFIPAKRSGSTGINEEVPIETIEVLTPFKDTIIDSEGGPLWTGYYEITVWDSGSFILPGPMIALGKEKLQFPSVSFTGKLSPIIQGIDTYDIKESFTELPAQTWKEQLTSFFSNYGWIVILMVITLIGWLYFRKRRKGSVDQQELTLFEQAVKRLQDLEHQGLWRNGKVKMHYSELSLVLRSYLSSVYELQLLERTTSEALLLIAPKIASKDHLDTIKGILESSDLVKFAKLHPEENEVLSDLHQSLKIISVIHEQTTPTDEQ